MKFSRNAESDSRQARRAVTCMPRAMTQGQWPRCLRSSKPKTRKTWLISRKHFASHPAPPESKGCCPGTGCKISEHEEYVISSSEFQRAKGRLLRLSNARASTAGALAAGDDGAPGRPTLKRRQPTPDDSTTNPDTGEQKSGNRHRPNSRKMTGQNRHSPELGTRLD